MTSERERTLRSTQRKMMRTILGRRRGKVSAEVERKNELQTWVAWVRQATHDALDKIQVFDVPCWVEEVRRRKFRWAGHVARRSDGRWTSQVISWHPRGARATGRPLLRWVDSIRDFFKALLGEDAGTDDVWMEIAQDRDHWKTLEYDYAANHWRR